jgi:Acetyltransferase (GNAT) domain
MQIDTFDLSTPHYQSLLQEFVHDIYHHSGYVLAEASRANAQANAISISDGSKHFLLPYLLRKCPKNLCESISDRLLYDVASPYGYPGILLNREAQNEPSFLQNSLDLLTKTFQSQNICSAFIRLHPILNTDIQKNLTDVTVYPGGMTVSIDLSLSEQEQWHQMQSSRRTKVNRCRRRGFYSTILPFLQEHISVFMDIYRDTMDRLNAKHDYYFDQAYYESLICLSPHVFICLIENGNQSICGGIFTECDGIIQYHLGGTKTEFLPVSPSNLMFDEVRLWAKARGNTVFHLGGGLGSQQDSLFDFKASFSKQRHHFCTVRLITDPQNYQNLVKARARQMEISPDRLLDTTFFPAYRALEF